MSLRLLYLIMIRVFGWLSLLGRRTPQSPELATTGAPSLWNTYPALDSVDDAVAKVEAAGGQVAIAPFDVTDAVRMAFVLDPSGAAVAFWQADLHIGASLVNEPGTITWNELITTEPSAAAFYEQVLGLATSVMDMGSGEYTLFEAAGQEVGGTVAPQMPGVPNHWHVHFDVANADASVAKVTERRGSILAEPFDTPVGRTAVVGDPQGAAFSIIQPAGQTA